MHSKFCARLLSVLFCVVFCGIGLLAQPCKGQAIAPELRWHVYIVEAKRRQMAGEHESAENFYQSALKNAKSLTDNARSSFETAEQDYYQTRQQSLAKTLSKLYAAKEPDPQEIANTHMLLAKNDIRLKQYDAAEAAWKEALTILEKDAGKNSQPVEMVLDELAQLYQLENKPDMTSSILKLKTDRISARNACIGPNINFQPYIDHLQKAIRANWYPPILPESTHIVTRMKIYPDGSLHDIRFKTKSKFKTANAAALKALNLTNPLPSLPTHCNDFMPMEFTFNFEAASLINYQYKLPIKPSKVD